MKMDNSAAPERRTVEFEAKTNFALQSHISSMLYKDTKYASTQRFSEFEVYSYTKILSHASPSILVYEDSLNSLLVCSPGEAHGRF